MEPVSSSPGLPAALAARARAATDGRLALDVAVGVVAVIGFGIWRPALWLIGLSAGAGLAAFGVWGIAEREIHDRTRGAGPRPRLVLALRVLQGISIGAGILAVAVAGLTLFGMALGTWIS